MVKKNNKITNRKKKNVIEEENEEIINEEDLFDAFNNPDEISKEEFEEIEEENFENVDDSDIVLGDSRSMFFQEMKKYSLLSVEREKALTKLYKTGTPEERKSAKETLIYSNIRLVVSIAKKYSYITNLPEEDLIQEGIIGLTAGIEKFDYKRGYKLSTYVTNWIRQAIARYISNNGRIIRLPVHIYEKLGKYNKVKREYFNKKGIEPDNKTMAKILKVNVKDIEKINEYSKDAISLNEKLGEDDDISIEDMVADKTTISPEEYSEQVMIKLDIDKALSTLKDREKEVIKMRYGLDDNNAQTLEMVGKKLNVTRERVRQIENVALRKLKFRVKGLKDIL